MKILVIDNYDSFTYNLVQYLKDFSAGEVVVRRNDEIELEEIEVFDKILISPGPGLPENAGIIKEVIKQYGSSKPILGVCLGMQAIAEVYGGDLINLDWLSLFWNELTNLPESIGNLVNLEILELCYSKLTSLPESIGNLVNLKQLNLSFNQLTELP
jgi:anthranilate synthase component 2